MEWFERIPVAGIFALLFAVALLRGQATYWIARLAVEASGGAEPAEGSRVARWLNRPLFVRARRLLEGWGLPIVSLSYLTVGLQSAVLASAGVLRLQWWRFSVAQTIGALGWAAIYTTIGVAAWQAVLRTLSWQMLVGIACALGIVLGVSLYLRHLRARRSERAAPETCCV